MHRIKHFEAAKHSFSMDLTSGRIWDYNSDSYVHRVVMQEHQAAECFGFYTRSNFPEHPELVDDLTGIEDLFRSQLTLQKARYESLLTNLQAKISSSANRNSLLTEELAREQDLRRDSQSKCATYEAQTEASEHRHTNLTQKLASMTSIARLMEVRYKSEQAISDSLMTRLSHTEAAHSHSEATAERYKQELVEMEETIKVKTS